MVNKKGGKKYKRTAKTSYATKFPKKKADYEDYGYVISMDGGKHCKILLSDGLEYKGVMRGSLKKKHIFIKRDGFILVERRDFQDSKVDITFQYQDEQLDELKEDKTFKSLNILVDRRKDTLTYNNDEINKEPDKEEVLDEQEEDFYSMMNKLSINDEIDVNDI